MHMLNKKTLIKYTLASLAFGILSTCFTWRPGLFVNIINILFISGLFALSFGLISYIRKVGVFDIFMYSFGLLRAYSKHFEDDLKDENPRTYLQYKEDKTRYPISKEPLTVGILFIIASIVLSFLCTI